MDGILVKGGRTMIFIILLALVVVGSFISGAFVSFFQKKLVLGFILLIVGLIGIYLFYYSFHVGWLTVPENAPSMD
jgi:hypothetical protein